MANSLTTVEQIAWENFCERSESMDAFLQSADMYKPKGGYLEAAGNGIRLPYQNQIQTTNGLDVTGNEQDIADLSVEVSTAKTDIKNGYFTLDVTESRFDRRVTENVDAAITQLAVEFNSDISDTLRDQATVVCSETTALSTFSHYMKANTRLRQIQAPASHGQYMYLGPENVQGLSDQLASRATDNNRDHDAWGMAKLGKIARFDTYDADTIGILSGSASSGVTVDGANQKVTPVAFDTRTALTGDESNDIRTQTLTVSSSHGLVAGDCITLAGVNSIAQLSKKDTGQLKTFRVTAVATNDLTISPAMVTSGAYQNVTAVPVDTAAVTVINTDDVEPAVFTTKNAGTFLVSDIDWKRIEGSDRVIESYTTKYGLSFYFIRIGDGITGQVRYRICAWGKYNLKNPEHCGIILGGQNAAI